MRKRRLGKTGYRVSEIGFGGWAIGADWGRVSRRDAEAALTQAVECGINFFDTADVYGDGRSERLMGSLRKKRREKIFIATKAGRRLNPHVADKYIPEAVARFVNRSLKNLGLDTIDLLQLHCPPTPVYYNPKLFAGLDQLVAQGKIRHWGVSVEKVEEALKAIEYPGLSTVQIIYNMFRQRPAERFFKLAKQRNIGIIVRVPLASGMLTGKMRPRTRFAADDHRNFNRHGAAFDVGETFAGVPYEVGLSAVSELQKLKPKQATMAQFALRWILMEQAVSTVIAGAKNPQQVADNAATSGLPALSDKTMAAVARVYEEQIKPRVHQRW